MFDKLKSYISDLARGEADKKRFDVTDKKLAAAALMFHVIAADGEVSAVERQRLQLVLHTHYDLTDKEAKALVAEAQIADGESVDLYSFTSVLKRQMIEEERILLIEDLWEMVFADGNLHELEDNVVWRIAELLGISGKDRMTMKNRVLNRKNTPEDVPTDAIKGGAS